MKLNQKSPFLQSREFKEELIEGFKIFKDELQENYEDKGIEQLDGFLHAVKCLAFGTIQILAKQTGKFSGTLKDFLKTVGENSDFLVDYFDEVLGEELNREDLGKN